VRYPEIRVKLRTENALVLVSAVRHEMRRAGLPRDEIHRFSSEALAVEDPAMMRRVCSDWVDAAAE
jgi:hypothetical protein